MKKLTIGVFPQVIEKGEIYGYVIEPLIYTPENLSPNEIEKYLNHLENNPITIEQLQSQLDKDIKIINITYDFSDKYEPLYDIIIEDPGIDYSNIRNIILKGLEKMEVVEDLFETRPVDDCNYNENSTDLYVYFCSESIDIVK